MAHCVEHNWGGADSENCPDCVAADKFRNNCDHNWNTQCINCLARKEDVLEEEEVTPSDHHLRLDCLRLATTADGGTPDSVLKCAADFYDFVTGTEKDTSDGEEAKRLEKEDQEKGQYHGTRSRDRSQPAARGQEDQDQN